MKSECKFSLNQQERKKRTTSFYLSDFTIASTTFKRNWCPILSPKNILVFFYLTTKNFDSWWTEHHEMRTHTVSWTIIFPRLWNSSSFKTHKKWEIMDDEDTAAFLFVFCILECVCYVPRSLLLYLCRVWYMMNYAEKNNYQWLHSNFDFVQQKKKTLPIFISKFWKT